MGRNVDSDALTKGGQMAEDNRLIDEQTAKKVLDRALELDEAKHGSFSVEQLRDVARDMAISPSSIEQALEEQKHESQGAAVPVPEQPRGFKHFLRPSVVTLLVLLALVILVAGVRFVVPPQ
jgi:hypothetical protein